MSLRKTVFGRQKYKVNTFIGGIGGTINTRELLATSLNINSNRIKLFNVTDGVNIECCIIGNQKYSISFDNSQLTYFYDYPYLVENILTNGLRNLSSFKRGYFPGIINQTGINILQDIFIPNILEMPNCLSIPNNFIGNYNASGDKRLILPKCTTLGTTKGNDGVFRISNSGRFSKAYFPISEQTSNGGNVEGDIAQTISNGTNVIYVSNYTLPNKITDLSIGTVGGTTLQLNFTPPSSVNGVDFYEIYLNNIFKQEVTASGQTITGLTPNTAYNIKVIAVDIFYNKSEFSNIITVSTTL